MSFVALFPQPRPRSAVRDELLTKESPWSSKGHSATPKCCQMKLVLDTFPSLLPVFMRGAQTWMVVPIVLVKSWGQTEGSSSSPGSQAFPLFSTDEALGN